MTMILSTFEHDLHDKYSLVCVRIYACCAYMLMCMICMICNLHDLCLYIHVFLCDLRELYYVNASLCLYGLIIHSLSACLG